MKQFINAFGRQSLLYIYRILLPGISTEKINYWILNVPRIRQLMNDPHFVESIKKTQKSCEVNFVLIKIFLTAV